MPHKVEICQFIENWIIIFASYSFMKFSHNWEHGHDWTPRLSIHLLVQQRSEINIILAIL